ncbi:MAG: hypothetical protein IJD49_03735 [Clostridia bacterium]|nr:hypothetical protein [Clostridia bacterium]
MAILMRIVGFILAVITPFASMIVWDPTAYFDKNVTVAQEKVGGFMKGVCHADPQYDLLNEAGIEWFRDDIPFPYNKDGSISQHYLNWKAESQEYVNNGVRIFGVTPYPDDYIEYGLDPRNPESRKGIQDIARFYVEDLKGIVGAFQITNEMGIDRFTLPLTLDEAAEFIGMQLEAMYPVRGDILIGYNVGGLSILQLPFKMMKYHEYCDYVGLDMYLGCFENVLKNPDQYITILNFVRRVTGKPVVMCEFGYIGYGEPKTAEEKKAILQKYGYNSEEEARADIDNFISRLPEDMKEEIIEDYSDRTPEERADLIFNGEYSNHLYCELAEGFGLYNFPHTPEGQAEFFEYIIPKVRNVDYVIGMFVYCWGDSDSCYVCGQADCPVETGWGLVDGKGNPKPSYYAVKEAYNKD